MAQRPAARLDGALAANDATRIQEQAQSRRLSLAERRREEERLRASLKAKEERSDRIAIDRDIDRSALQEKLHVLALDELRLMSEGAIMVLAPKAGIVHSVRVDVGDSVRPGKALLDRSTLRELRSKFRLSLRGMTLRRLRDCAESLGLACRGVHLELAELNRLRTPAVLHWELDHFVVLQSANRRRIVVVDPALGRRRFTYEEAGSRFTGVALEVWPTPALQPKRAVETVKLSAFLAPLKGLGATLAGVFAMTLLLQGFALIMPLNTQFTVDHGIRQGDMHIVVALAIGFGLLTAISTATGYLIGSINASARLARFGLHLGLAGSTLGNVENLVMLLLGAHKVIEGEFAVTHDPRVTARADRCIPL